MIEPEPLTTITPRMISWGRNSALFRLNQRDMSENELFEAIKRKSPVKFPGLTPKLAASLARQTVDFCLEMKLLNDARFAEVKARSAAYSGKSKRQVAMKLQEKGISEDTSSSALEEYDDQRSAIIYCRKRGFGPYRRDQLADDKRLQKEISALMRNGYSYSLANTTIALTREEAENILSAQA